MQFTCNSPVSAYEYLYQMPAIPFRFYIQAFITLLEPGSEVLENCFEPSDLANCFLRLIENKIESDLECIFPILPSLLETARYVATNQSLYDAPVEIYGDFSSILSAIELSYANVLRST